MFKTYGTLAEAAVACDANNQFGPHGKCSFSFCLTVNKQHCCVGKETEIDVLTYLTFSLVGSHFLPYRATAPSGARQPHYRDFTIKLGRTPLDV